MICIKCKSKGTPAVAGKTMCEYHLAKNNEYKRNWQLKNAAKGRCMTCGGVKKGKWTRCDKCNKAHNTLTRLVHKRNRARGLCADCAKEAHGRWRCTECAAKHEQLNKKRRARLASESKCMNCGLPLDDFNKAIGRLTCMCCSTKKAEKIRI